MQFTRLIRMILLLCSLQPHTLEDKNEANRDLGIIRCPYLSGQSLGALGEAFSYPEALGQAQRGPYLLSTFPCVFHF